jgi:integrase
MAALQLRSDRYRVIFRYHGKQHTLNLGRVSETEAAAKSAQVDYLLMRLKQGLIEVPAGIDIVDFVEHDGKMPLTPAPGPAPQVLSLADLRDRYLTTYASANENNTLGTAKIHFRHLSSTFGPQFPLPDLKPPDLQRHIDRRGSASVAPVTIRKEIATLGTAWNWANRTGLIATPYPNSGLVYPKTSEKPPFQTREEIERQVRRARLDEAAQSALWECLYLTLPDITALLDHVKTHAVHPWIYPMVCLAAHTGARRSELLRAQVSDVDFEGETILIHERKRQKGRRTTRRAPISPFLYGVLKAWLDEHPGGAHLFCHGDAVDRSRTRSRTTGHQAPATRPTSLKGRRASVRLRDRPASGAISKDEAHDHLRRTLHRSPWEILRGWHVLRHSFVSCCASAGVDQRIIDEWVGHTTGEMRRRYRHLIPSIQKKAIRTVFG